MAKRRVGSQIGSQPLKVKNRPDFLACRWRATYRWKPLDKGYNFASDLISIVGLHAKVRAPKVVGVPVVGILGLPLGSPGTKCQLGAGLVAKHRVYYKGEVVASPKFGPWWVLWVWVCPWLIRAPKVLQLCTNQLVIWFVQVVWVIDCLSFFLVPSRSSSTPFYP
jgi:hypothetical protein